MWTTGNQCQIIDGVVPVDLKQYCKDTTEEKFAQLKEDLRMQIQGLVISQVESIYRDFLKL